MGSFKNLKERLLYAFTGNVARNGSVFALAANLVNFVYKDNAPFCCAYVTVSCVNQLEQYILYVFAYVTGFCKGCGVRNCKRNLKLLCQSLCKKGFSASGRTKKQDVGLFNFYVRFQLLFLWNGKLLVVVVYSNGKNLLCHVLSNNVLVQVFLEFLWRRDIFHVYWAD